MGKFSVAIQGQGYQKLISDTLGDKELARQFVADISTVVSQNKDLQLCDPATILSAGLMASSLKLPLSQSLGFAYVIPYGDKATLQLGYKAYIQLAQRSGQFRRLGVKEVHKGEVIGQDEFGDDIFKFDHKFDDKEIVGYYAYFELLNGFKKTMYWTVEQCLAHGKRYSKSYNKLWKENPGVMCQKTVLKLLLSRYAPLSVEMQKAIQSDQAVINDDGSVDYVDNPNNDEENPPVPVEAEQPKGSVKNKLTKPKD